MRIESAELMNFRCIKASSVFEVERDKTILVGINEAGKTALLKALQHASPTEDTPAIDHVYDAPAGIVDDIRRGIVRTSDLPVARVVMHPEPQDFDGIESAELRGDIRLVVTAMLDGTRVFTVSGLAAAPLVEETAKPIVRLSAAMSKQADVAAREVAIALTNWKEAQSPQSPVTGEVGASLSSLLDMALPLFQPGSAAETYWDEIDAIAKQGRAVDAIVDHLAARMPPFVYFSSYFAVRPRIHLNRLAEREASGEIDMSYDFGNLQLLKFLGFTARELSDMVSEAPVQGPNFATDVAEQNRYREELAKHERRVTERKKALQAAGRRLTNEIRRVWGDERLTIRLDVDGQYLQTLVEDESTIPVELDQRSEGFRWLVSFFVVFHAQARDALKDAVLLLDEPGLSLHALKQQEFRKTVSQLAEGNQIIYTTHSPFMVGSDELDLVRVVEMVDRETGTRVHTRLAVDDPRSIYPLQAALGYDLAQSMFTHQSNLVVEGVTDLLYLEALNEAFRSVGGPSIDEQTAIVPAGSASKVVYYSTILTSQKLKVAALLDSDAAGDQAANQDALWQLLTQKRILRTGDHIEHVERSEIEDLLRETLTDVARDVCGWDSTATVGTQPNRPLMEILLAEHPTASKWKLARAFTKWLAANGTEALTESERVAWSSLSGAVNRSLT